MSIEPDLVAEYEAKAKQTLGFAARRPRQGQSIGAGTAAPLGDSVSTLVTASGAAVIVRRTARRKSGIAAFWENGKAVVAAPARLSVEDEAYWVPHMLNKLEASNRRGGKSAPRIPASDQALARRASELSAQYLAARAQPASIRWVTNQKSRWGSCTHQRGTIRISDAVQGMPSWVVDYVILHELAHLIHPNHSQDFWAELEGFPHKEKATAFLDGAAFAAARNLQAADPSDLGGISD